MSCRVLLLSANRYQFPDPVLPLGLSCINAALVGAGHQTECMDVNIDSLDSVGHVINEFCPDYIGVSLRNIDDVLIKKRETPFSEAIALCDFLRQKSKAPIIIGGAGYSIFPERLLELTGASYG